MHTTYAQVDLTSLFHNLFQITSRLSGSCDLLAVVKANAYGHGATEIARALIQQGVSRLAVVSVSEGTALRESGIAKEIVVLGPMSEKQIPEAIAFRLTPVIGDSRLIPALARAASAQNRALPIHIKIDTGMGRLVCRRKRFHPSSIRSRIASRCASKVS